MWGVINDFKIIELIFEDRGRLAFDKQFRHLPRFTLELFLHPINLIQVDVAVASRPNKIARLQITLLRNQVC